MLVTGYWILDTGYWILDIGRRCRMKKGHDLKEVLMDRAQMVNSKLINCK